MISPDKVIEYLTKYVGCNFYTCKSSNIITYGYNSKDHTLWVVFKGNKIYQYKGILKEEFQSLQEADSKGKWVNANLVKTQVNFISYELQI